MKNNIINHDEIILSMKYGFNDAKNDVAKNREKKWSDEGIGLIKQFNFGVKHFNKYYVKGYSLPWK
jgi:hypothetical protein